MNKYDHNYSAYFNVPNEDYPEGSAVDATSEDGLDGTPVLAAWFNDLIGFCQAAFHKAFGNPKKEGDTVTREVSGVPDTAQKSDVLDALESIMDSKDSVLSAKIDTEATNRTNADTALQSNIDAEKSEREAADTTLQSKITEEKNARVARDTDLQNQINAIKNSGSWCPYPVGAVYVQFPTCEAPGALWKGTQWENINFGGAFFRSEGGNADTFNKEEYQGETLPNIRGDVFLYGATADGRDGGGTANGAFSEVRKGYYSGGGTKSSSRLFFNANKSNGTYQDSAEVRPRNKTIRIWRRLS